MANTVETSAEAPQTESAVEDQQSAVLNVQSQIDVLTDLSKRLQALRQIPSGLLRSENPSGRNPVLHVVFSLPNLKDTFRKSVEELRTLHTAAMEEKVQEALRVAAESERRDGTEVKDASSREKQRKKRSRSPTPESPRPYLSLQHKHTSPFPSLAAGTAPLTLKELPTYIQEFNARHAKKMLLHVYLTSPSESRNVTVPVVLRFLFPDVLRAFIALDHEEGIDGVVSKNPPLIVESLTVFGPREKASGIKDETTSPFTMRQKPPYSQSEFIIFQRLSQWVMRVLQSSPRVPVQSFMDMLIAYENLFLEKCSLCQRFLSAEGYLPSVARVRREDGAWEPQHATCVLN